MTPNSVSSEPGAGHAGGSIGGNGTLGNTTINGGTLAPGNSIGTLSINGNLVLTSAAAYIVEVSPTQADRTNVTGTATLDSFSDLTLTQNGADVYVRYGANATLILKNHVVAEVTAQSFVFDPTGTDWSQLL